MYWRKGNNKKGGEVREQILIEWNEGGLDGATWEDKITIQEQFLELNLGHKIDLQEGVMFGVGKFMRKGRS